MRILAGPDIAPGGAPDGADPDWSRVPGAWLSETLSMATISGSHQSPVARPGGQWIVTGTADRVIHVWDATSRKKVSEIDVRPKELASFALNPDENFLVTALEEHTAEVFETRNGAKLAELTGHTGPVRYPASARMVNVSSRRISMAK